LEQDSGKKGGNFIPALFVFAKKKMIGWYKYCELLIVIKIFHRSGKRYVPNNNFIMMEIIILT